MPYTVTVRDRCMYSHTLKFGDGDGFRTGCTAVVDAVFTGGALTDDGVLIDITVAQCVPRAAPRARDLKAVAGARSRTCSRPTTTGTSTP